MIYVILFLSILFITIGFIVTETNSKYLLSGYNTMSEEEQENVDIKSYIVFFRNFHIFLGSSLLVFSLLIYYLINKDWSSIFLVLYPMMAYVFFIWYGTKFSKEEKKNQTTSIIGIVVLVGFLIFIGFEFVNGIKENTVSIKNDTIEISGSYGENLKIKDIKSVELLTELPNIKTKTNGFSLETIKKGYFKTDSGEKVKLIINSKNNLLVLIITKSGEKIFYNSKEEKHTLNVYNLLKNQINKP